MAISFSFPFKKSKRKQVDPTYQMYQQDYGNSLQQNDEYYSQNQLPNYSQNQQPVTQTENQQNNTLELEKFPNKFEPKFEQSKKFEVVGVFSFLKIGNEVQLHYTAGKTTLTNNFVGKKLPILTAAMLDILKNSPNYQKTKKLTFSNKDESVSKAYESVGFELLQNRKCLLIK